MLPNPTFVYQLNKQRHQEFIDQARKHDLIRELRDEQTGRRAQAQEVLSILLQAIVRRWEARRTILNPGLKHHSPQT